LTDVLRGNMNYGSEHELLRLVDQIRAQLLNMDKPRNYKVAYGGVLALLHHVLDVVEQSADDEDPIGDIIAADRDIIAADPL
jgi:hypothetical protein